MSRKLISTLTAVVALSGIVSTSALLWPDTASSTVSQIFPVRATATARGDVAARADLEQVFASVETGLPREYVPAFLPMIDFERHFAGDNALPRREYVPVRLTAIEFERVFRSVTRARPHNTPPNREKLRNAGWKRLLQVSERS